MVSEFVYRDHSRNDAYALRPYTQFRVLMVLPKKLSDFSKEFSAVENSCLLGAQ